MYYVSTHSRPKAAGERVRGDAEASRVSTHSRPKAAGCLAFLFLNFLLCFNTQPPEGGWITKQAFAVA